MGEIRSTIDIIMERTRGMTLSSQERHDLEQEELRKRVRGLLLRLKDNPDSPDEVLNSLNDEPPDKKTLLLSLLWKEIIEELPSDKGLPADLDLLARLPQGPAKEAVIQELRAAYKSGIKSSAEDKKKLAAEARKKLQAAGISGSAVIPILRGSADESADVRQLMDRFRPRLLA